MGKSVDLLRPVRFLAAPGQSDQKDKSRVEHGVLPSKVRIQDGINHITPTGLISTISILRLKVLVSTSEKMAFYLAETRKITYNLGKMMLWAPSERRLSV